MPDRFTGREQTHTGYTARHERLLKRRPGAIWAVTTSLTANGARDRFTIANTATTDYPLTFVPRTDTLNLFLNGLALDEGVDYSVDYDAPSIVLTASASRAVGQIMWARYLTADAGSTSTSTILTWGIRSNKTQIIGSFASVALIDSGQPFTDISADLDPTVGAGDCSIVFAAQNFFDPSTATTYYYLRADPSGVTGIYRFDRMIVGGSPSDTDTALRSISLTGAANYGVTWDGTQLHILQGGTVIDSFTPAGGDAANMSRSIIGLRSASGGGTFDNLTANGGAVTDAFDRPDADQLGRADTGQTWVGTS